MTLFWFLAATLCNDGIPAIFLPFAMFCDTALLVTAMLTGVIHV